MVQISTLLPRAVPTLDKVLKFSFLLFETASGLDHKSLLWELDGIMEKIEYYST